MRRQRVVWVVGGPVHINEHIHIYITHSQCPPLYISETHATQQARARAAKRILHIAYLYAHTIYHTLNTYIKYNYAHLAR